MSQAICPDCAGNGTTNPPAWTVKCMRCKGSGVLKMKQSDEICVHRECGGLVKHLGPDGISYCEDCDHICEGDTEYISEEEWEKRQE